MMYSNLLYFLFKFAHSAHSHVFAACDCGSYVMTMMMTAIIVIIAEHWQALDKRTVAFLEKLLTRELIA
jgi:hypothetical protein